MHNKLSTTFLLLVLLVTTASIFTLNSLMLLLGISSTVAAFISTLTTFRLLLWSTDSESKPWILTFLRIQDWAAMAMAAVAVAATALTGSEALVAVAAMVLVLIAATALTGDGTLAALAVVVAAEALTGPETLVPVAAMVLVLIAATALTGDGTLTAVAVVVAVAATALTGSEALAAALDLAGSAIGIRDNPLLAISAIVSSLALVMGLRIYNNHKQLANENILCTLSLLFASTFIALSAGAVLIFALVFPSAVAFTCSYSLAVTATSVLLFAAASLLRDLSLSLRSSLMQQA